MHRTQAYILSAEEVVLEDSPERIEYGETTATATG